MPRFFKKLLENLKALNYKKGFTRIWIVLTITFYGFYFIEELDVGYYQDKYDAIVEIKYTESKMAYFNEEMMSDSCGEFLTPFADLEQCCFLDLVCNDYKQTLDSHSASTYDLQYYASKKCDPPPEFSEQFYKNNKAKIDQCAEHGLNKEIKEAKFYLNQEIKELIFALLIPFFIPLALIIIYKVLWWVLSGFKQTNSENKH